VRRTLPFIILLLTTTSCGSPMGDESAPPGPSDEMSESADTSAPSAPMSGGPASRTAGPNVGVTAAPGVAFSYRYSFRLPADHIATVQEQHARTCEELGVARCRITGMRYRVLNEHDVEAMLAFKLEPSLARRFGQAGVETVQRADGMLTESEITGADVGTSIQRSGRSIAEMTAELRRIEAQIERRNLPPEERTRLEYDASQIRQSIQALQANREEQRETLANTPMVFNYGSGRRVPGFAEPPSFSRALEQAGRNFVEGLYVLFVILITLLPWVLAALLGWGIIRAVRRRMRSAPPSAPPATPTPDVS